ncbi:hypothetical protein NIES4075_15870 [Tolypothrix sp. NIES-4075]|uniref:hypothetical protein n=1 Tax=Tolypothrix sp. NIES-4075 TaxID=2005459 RepID=UPI000B5C3DC3|nr:hypothetical protein [Tolypothrix sp. NIES-4075]GAX40621.1 hypothetical protein NIES4075_15870 [Tolypothrix sp. NIES-4075]
MNHTLRLQIPETLYEPLVKVAAQMGRTPEELAIDWLAAAVQEYVDDPLEKFIGAFSSNIPDWADQHDRYIGQSLINTGNTEENS